MSAALPHETLDDLPRTPASDVKKLGWRGVMKCVHRHGRMVVTNHSEPEAVILPVEEYERLLRLDEAAGEQGRAVLQELREKYDARLAWLQEPGAGDVLESILDQPLELGGSVIAGKDS